MLEPKFEVKPSPIHGDGLFAAEDIEAGRILMRSSVHRWGDWSGTFFSKINHASSANTVLLRRNCELLMVAMVDIWAGSEITANYNRLDIDYEVWYGENLERPFARGWDA